jgi:hypothetical protein
MKTLVRFMTIFAAIGIVVALVINAFWSIYERTLPSGDYLPLFKATLVLFPASIGTMAISGTSYWSAGTFGLIGLNAIIYAVVGLLTWLGLRRNKSFFVLEFLLFIVFLGAIWTLH